jgi:hypothetical protein
MPECPHCKKAIDGKAIRGKLSFKPYKSCPFCKQPFTVDVSTKNRQVIATVFALISLALTLGMYFQGMDWLIPSIVSYLLLGVFIYWGNKHVVFVVYEKVRMGTQGRESKKIFPYMAIVFGTLIAITGAVFVVMYVLEAIVARTGEPDQSLLFWYLPFLFAGVIGMAIGIGVSVLGFSRLRTIRHQFPHQRCPTTRCTGNKLR